MNLALMKRYGLSWVRNRRQFSRDPLPRHCPICGYKGIFVEAGRPSRWAARCPSCESRERHRLAYLYYKEEGIGPGSGSKILHFAPEFFMLDMMKDDPDYICTDPQMPHIERKEDMNSLTFDDNTFDIVIAHHVLEHIPDDAKAMSELFRVLKPGGKAILSVPQNLSREETFEDTAIVAPNEREIVFGARDHVRFYGRDFSERLANAGFQMEVFRTDPVTEMKHGLQRDEVIHIGTKPRRKGKAK